MVIFMAIVRIQGYHSDLNKTAAITHDSNVSSDDRHQKKFNWKEYESVFKYYRSDGRSREPKFISFQTKDDNIEVEIDFAVPFLSIPVKRSLSGAMGVFQNVIRVRWNYCAIVCEISF